MPFRASVARVVRAVESVLVKRTLRIVLFGWFSFLNDNKINKQNFNNNIKITRKAKKLKFEIYYLLLTTYTFQLIPPK